MKNTIAELQKKYAGKIDRLDLDVLIAAEIGKSREFIMTYPESELPKLKIENLKLKIARRMRDEPLAYILGHKEFYALNFKVTPDTLIPRPETELLVSQALQEVQDTITKHQTSNIIDVGTGSGNIIISVAKATENFKFQISNFKFIGIDISLAALAIAKKNAKDNEVAEKIKFFHGNLLTPMIENCKLKIENSRMIILANLPYLSQEIYTATLPNVKKYEPKSALWSAKEGLDHYERLLKQIQKLLVTSYGLQVTVLLEISPEQKTKLPKIIKTFLPKAQIEFKKDLANKWRVCKIII